ncbi:myo-inositol-1(or 4)-monophosphatase [Schistosoma bovis]|uniref:inositol-phosphate phosphatase n=1 Tax=Schistosoma bovis TaxID=6184 RepID=A0A430QNT3_SCHBO|nr:myo-inositol-1(or 4)-monophosphatase [Schistosoma bovis]
MADILFVSNLAVKAGKMIEAGFSKSIPYDKKESYADLVTEVDKAVENYICQEILSSFPTHKIIAEEGYSGNAELTCSPTWIIDPIDGTSNFVSRVRTMGSAALHMCQIAAGNGDIFFEFGIHCWDYAAAVLIVREAGGFCCNFDGKPVDLMARNVICAGTPELANALIPLIQPVGYARD